MIYYLWILLCKTSNHEVSLADQENFQSDSDTQNLSPLDEDAIIYINIKKPNLNEDIINSPVNTKVQEMEFL